MRTHDALYSRVIAVTLACLAWSCSGEPTPPAVPAPVPEAPLAPTPAPIEPAPAAPEPAAPTTPIAPEPSAAPDAPKPIAKADTKPIAKPDVKPIEKPIAEPVAPEPKPAEKPVAETSVRVPQSAHVRTTVPKAMQALLDADTRMQPWVDNTLRTIEGCYAEERAKNEQALGTVVVAITMHANSRPDADVKTLPPQLSGVFACASGKLMRAPRMPLFTGPEGATHTLQITFAR